jgi:hypothetical protein
LFFHRRAEKDKYRERSKMQPKHSNQVLQTQIENPPSANGTAGMIHESSLRKTETHFVYDGFANRFFGFRIKRVVNLCLVLLLLTACGNESNQHTSDPTPTSSFTLALGTNRLELTPGASGSVPVTLQKSEGFTNAVTLAVAGAPEGLTSTFSSNPAEDSSELNINLTESVTPGTHTLFVQGLSGELRQSQALEVVVLSPVVTTITVTGKVVSDVGQPLAKARVRIGATVAITDTEGAFRIEGVNAPYDLIIAVPQIGNQSEHAHIFQGLTRPDPTLPLFLNFNQAGSGNATVLGNLSGGAGFPNPLDHITRVGFASVEGSRERFLSEEDGPDFSIRPVFFQGERTLGTLYAFQYLDNASIRGRIETYTGYAEKPLELTNEAEFSDQDLSLKPVTTGFLSANITTPAEFPLDEVLVGVELGTAEFLPIRDFSPDSNVTYAVPEIGKGLSLHVTTNRVDGRESEVHRAGLLPNEAADLTLPVPPKALEPDDDTEGVDTETRIAWEGLEGGISIVEFRFFSQINSRFLVYTKATETRFPDLGPEGLNPSANTFVSWHVQGFGPYASLDDFTAPEAACGIRCNGSGKSYAAGTSEILSFKLR